jgi:S-formylglutathione hydrolase FrmB
MLPVTPVTLGVFRQTGFLTDCGHLRDGKMTPMPELSRRTVLRLGAGVAAGAAAAHTVGGLLQRQPAVGTPEVAMTGVGAPLAPPPAAPAPTMVTGSFVSAARGGASTNWAIARPPGQTAPLRPLIALHGKGSDAATVMAGGVEQGLAQAVDAGLPPFAVVAVDGGGSYWHQRSSGEDSGAMVLDELLPMLGAQGLDISRVGFIGWSMGGYGALLLGARLGPARTAAICAVSPALWTSPGAAAPGAFDGADDFAANSVWGLPALASIPIRIDCGTGDPFYGATQEFISQLSTPPSGGFSPGGHDGSYWSSQLPAELTWIAPLLAS